jgi:hypothetical protein
LKIAKLVDEQIEAKLKADGVVPAPQADDAAVIRRTTLDLVGRIPTPAEIAEYTQSRDSDKRLKLITRLMASSSYARYQATLFDVMLSDRPGQGALRSYFTTAIQENRPWDQIFRELMKADETDPKLKGAADFLRPKLNDLDKLTSDVSVAFFGVNVSCAQCHDHPNVADWKQDHFYGMKAFLSRTYLAGTEIAERPAGVVKFKPTKGPERAAKMMFLTGKPIESETARELTSEEQKKEKELQDKSKTAKNAPPPPAFSARAKLVEVALQPNEANFFAKSIVNRMWHRFFGWGLVNPLDQMHSENEPSHPELLDALAQDTVKHNYDLKRLIEGLVLSKTYSRASKYESAAFPAPSSFAIARLKPLTPIQLATSLKIATTDPKAFEGLKPDELDKKLEQLESSARGFASLIAQPTDNFQIGVNEALLFSNSDRVMKEFLQDTPGTLLARVKAESDFTATVKLLMQTALGRAPTEEELKALKGFLETRKDRASEAQRQLLWAMLTSPEFRFNH